MAHGNQQALNNELAVLPQTLEPDPAGASVCQPDRESLLRTQQGQKFHTRRTEQPPVGPPVRRGLEDFVQNHHAGDNGIAGKVAGQRRMIGGNHPAGFKLHR